MNKDHHNYLVSQSNHRWYQFLENPICIKFPDVLNLQVAMVKSLVFSGLFVLMRLLNPLSNLDVEITSPREGQVVQGNIEIKGTAAGDGFDSAELAYAYAELDNPTWFVIGSISQPVNVSLLAVWDTTTISDGDYQLRLTVHYKDGSVVESVVRRVLVRNYTPVEITPTQPVVEIVSTVKPTDVPMIARATAYPVNAASLSTTSVEKSFKEGLILGIVCIVGLGVYAAFCGILRRR